MAVISYTTVYHEFPTSEKHNFHSEKKLKLKIIYIEESLFIHSTFLLFPAPSEKYQHACGKHFEEYATFYKLTGYCVN